MKSSIISIFIFIIFCQPIKCQSKARITDVDFHLEDKYIVVNYNLTGTIPKEQLTIELKFITENNENLKPRTINNDVGTKVYGDGKKEILWDINADNITISGNIKAVVTITSSKLLFSGPSNAFLSVFIPGLGGYFVDKNKIRSIVTTVSTVGLMVYGINEKIQANKYYKDYKASIVNSDIQTLYSKANNEQHKYYIATRIGAGLWLADIIWVYFKGIRNKEEVIAHNKFYGGGLTINYVNNGMQFGYSVTF